MDPKQIFADSNTNYVLLLLILLPLVQYVTGVLRAIANSTFDLSKLDIFIRTDVAGRILPLIIFLVLGRILDVAAPDTLNIPGLDLSLLTAGGIAMAVVYLVVVIQSIIQNVNPSAPDTIPTTVE